MNLGSDKTDFIIARLQERLAKTGLADYGSYCSLLESAAGHGETTFFAEALTTNTTSFFREQGQFNWLESDGLARLLVQSGSRGRSLTLWSAASSTGQELYSVMMLALGYLQDNDIVCSVDGIGTDLSRDVVAKARQAVYTTADIAGIPQVFRRRFLLSAKAQDGRYRIAPEVRRRTDFRVANLIERSSLTGIKADLVLLRNVLIYFTERHQKLVIDNVLANLAVGGYLLTGHAETGLVRDHGLEVIRPTIYRKVR